MILACKYRPKKMSEIVGQPTIVQTLSNALTQRKLHHAYLFSGKFGCGKTSMARILAASENCTTNKDFLHPCGSCALCKAVFAGTHTDISEIDAASNAGKVEQVRELKTAASYAPMDGAKSKYYIIDEAHRMSAAAEESLLKLLEEPPKRVRFILCTTEYQHMRSTIKSRCQIHEFKKIYWREISRYLEMVARQEKLTCDMEAINLCSKMSEGSMRNGLQNLEKLVDFAGGKDLTGKLAQEAFGTASDLVFYSLVGEIAKSGPPDATSGYLVINDLLVSGMGASQIFENISDVLRNILLGVSATACGNLILVTEGAKSCLKELLNSFKPKMQALLSIMEGLSKARIAVDQGLSLDIALQMWFLQSIFTFQKGGQQR